MSSTIRSSFEKIREDLDFHQSIISRTRGRFRKYPLRTLRYALINIFWKIVTRLSKNPLITARTFWGEHMRVVFPAYRSVYHFGILDSAELIVQKTLIERLKEGDTFIDVGANVGFYTLLGSALVGRSGQVHAFEPTPSTFSLLTENAGDKPNVRLNQIALGREVGEATLADFGLLESGLNSIRVIEHKGISSKKIRVPVTTLDSYCGVHGITPALIKMDIEGMEYEVLQGATATLKRARPVLILEVGKESEPLIGFLRSAGYTTYGPDDTLELIPFKENNVPHRMNLIFLPSE